MTDFTERASLGVRKLQPTIQLRFEGAVLNDEISFRASNSWSTVPVT